MFASRLSVVARRSILEQTKIQIRSAHHGHGHGHGVPYRIRGDNLPFKVNNPRALFVKFCIFMAIPYWIPYYVIRHQMIKNA